MEKVPLGLAKVTGPSEQGPTPQAATQASQENSSIIMLQIKTHPTFATSMGIFYKRVQTVVRFESKACSSVFSVRQKTFYTLMTHSLERAL